MKKLKMGLLALVSIVGIGGAFATTHKARTAAQVTYFAVSRNINNLNQYNWVTISSLPGTLDCTPVTTTASCTVISLDGTAPAQDSHPNTANFIYSDNSSLYK